MNRRGFVGSLVAAAAGPAIARKVLPAATRPATVRAAPMAAFVQSSELDPRLMRSLEEFDEAYLRPIFEQAYRAMDEYIAAQARAIPMGTITVRGPDRWKKTL